MSRNALCLLLLALSISAAACDEDSSSYSKPCNVGHAALIVKEDLTAKILDEANKTHESGYCLEAEKCVYLYKIEGKGLVLDLGFSACSTVGQGQLVCDGITVDALTDKENCGKCGGKCVGNAECKNGVCQDNCLPGEKRCSTEGSYLEVCNEIGSLWERDTDCAYGCDVTSNSCKKVCNVGEYKCANDGVHLSKCADNELVWEEAEKCNAGCDTNSSQCKQACNPGDNKCSSDHSTILTCKSNGLDWEQGVVCKTGCNDVTGECFSDDYCDDDDVTCSTEASNIVVSCSNHKLTTSVCSGNRVCKKGICILDTDGDGVQDEEDLCKYNASISSKNAELSEYKCIPYDKSSGTFYVYTAQNLLQLYGFWTNNKATDDNGNVVSINSASIRNVVLQNDVNLALLNNVADDGKCAISGFSALPLMYKTFDGNGKKIYAVRQSDGMRCSLSTSLFGSVTDSTIENLSVDLDVDGKKARAILAEEAISVDGEACSFSNIELSGTLSSGYDGALGVGGLVGYVKGSTDGSGKPVYVSFEQCRAEDISVLAPNADSVGGMIGKIDSSSARINWGETVHYIDTVKGNKYVGGLIGFSSETNSNVVTDNKLSNFIVRSVSGQSYVGGYTGTGVGKSIAIVADKIEGLDDYVGGGFGSHSSGSGTWGDLSVHINEVVGGNYIAGVFGGTSSASRHSIPNIYAEIGSITGGRIIGGVIGTAGGYAGGDYTNYNVSIGLIKSVNAKEVSTLTALGIGGLIALCQSVDPNKECSFENISICSNLSSYTGVKPNGLVGKGRSGAPDSTRAFITSNLMTASKRYVGKNTLQTSLSGAIGNEMAQSNVYYALATTGEYAQVDKNVEDKAIAYQESKLADVLAILGSNWEAGTCKLMNEDGSMYEYKMPVYKLPIHKAALENLKQIVKERGYFELYN